MIDLAPVLFALLLPGPPSPPAVATPLPLQDSAAQASAAPRYETRMVKRKPFTVGTTPKLEVWVGFRPERGPYPAGSSKPCLLVSIVNRGAVPIPFDPGTLRVWARGDRGDKPLRVYSAADYEKWLRNREAFFAGLGSPPPGDQNEGRTSAVVAQPSQALEPPPNAAGVPVIVERYPTPKVPTDTNGFNHVDRMQTARGPGEGSSVDRRLMRPHTVEPGAAYAGVVYFDKTRASAIRVHLKVGDEELLFEVPRQE
jgi:hypothetical protein